MPTSNQPGASTIIIQPNFVELEGALMTAAGRVTQVKFQATSVSKELLKSENDFQQLVAMVKAQQTMIRFLAEEIIILTRKTTNARNKHRAEIEGELKTQEVAAAAHMGRIQAKFNAEMSKMEAEHKAFIAQARTEGEKMQRALRHSSWSIFNGMLHLADSILDKTVDGWQQTMGSIISNITHIVTVAHAWSAAASASGNYVQAAIITANAIVIMSAQAQAQAQMANDKRNRDYTGSLMAGNRPW